MNYYNNELIRLINNYGSAAGKAADAWDVSNPIKYHYWLNVMFRCIDDIRRILGLIKADENGDVQEEVRKAAENILAVIE